MMSEEGRRDFYLQVQQIVGSIQKTNDLAVHMALIKCGSYYRKVREKFYRDPHSLEEEVRDYVNIFGFMQKSGNALDILIEDGKQLLKGWGGAAPNFLLTNPRLTFNLNMLPENTDYVTQGPDGAARLAKGPDMQSYRGIRIIPSRAFPVEEGSAPRDLLRRRVRVAEFYLLPNCSNGAPATGLGGGGGAGGNDGLIMGGEPRLAVGADGAAAAPQPPAGGEGPPLLVGGLQVPAGESSGEVRLYDESSDSFVVIPYSRILEQCRRFTTRANAMRRQPDDPLDGVRIPDTVQSVLLLRMNIEHQMIGIIMGTGGNIDTLGATLWGQTELSAFDDGQHGVWGMSYKYHASSLVFNTRNLIRFWDISYDGYVGGKDVTILDWGSDGDVARYIRADNNLAVPYSGQSIVVLPLPTKLISLPSPLPLANLVNSQLSSKAHALATADLFVEDMQGFLERVSERIGSEHIGGLRNAVSVMYDILNMHRNSSANKCACLSTMENAATAIRLAYAGTSFTKLSHEPMWTETFGCGHHGVDQVGIASQRAGRGIKYNNTAPRSVHLT